MKRILTSCFGLGFLPVCPGTYGSLPAAIIFAAMIYSGANTQTTAEAMGVLILAGAAVCIAFAPSIILATGKIDPAEIVADELAGQATAYLIILGIVPAETLKNHIWLIAAGGFAMFRLFDIFKPWPIRRLERLPAGLGIAADDLMAGLYAGLLTAGTAAILHTNGG